MSEIAVVTDSSACLPAELVRQYEIEVIPFGLIWDNEVYLDGISITPEEFYHRFAHSSTYPTTSQPSPQDFLSVYTRLVQERGVEGIVSIHIPEEVSGTIAQARLAAQEMAPFPVRVIDSRMATIAEGFVVLAAARAAAAGGGLEEVVAAAEAAIPRVNFYATLTTLEHVHRGGRIGQAAALLGSRLRLHPILHLRHGRVAVAGVVRSRRRARERMLELMAKQVGDASVRASVFHADALAEAEQLAEVMQARFHPIEFYITEFTPVMGAHTGPGVIGLAYHVEKEVEP